MPIRLGTLWPVTVFCMVAGRISYFLTPALGRHFFVVTTIVGGETQVSIDPLRSAIFHCILFICLLILGGLWFYLTMTRRELAISAGIATAIYLAVTLAQMYLPNFPVPLSVELAKYQSWVGAPASILQQLTGSFALSTILTNFSPLLLIFFGKRSTDP